MGSRMWSAKFGPNCLQGDPVRGYWVLFVPRNVLVETWQNIRQLTSAGRLRYRVSRCRRPMSYGNHEGDFAICCFCEVGMQGEILQTLEEEGLGGYVSYYALLKKFRNENDGGYDNDNDFDLETDDNEMHNITSDSEEEVSDY